MSALSKITNAGYTITFNDSGNLWIVPADKLTPVQIEFLKTHKAEIIEELQAANESKAKRIVTPLEAWQIAAISIWIRSLGGSETEIAEETADVIKQCAADPEAKAYFLERAAEILSKTETPIHYPGETHEK